MRTALFALTILFAGAARAQLPTVHFTGHTDYDLAESEPHQGFAADLDHDGKLDLVFTTTGGAAADGRINLFFGDGAGDFSDNRELTAGYAPWAVGSGDFDGDGWIDLVAAESSQAHTGVYVWRNNHNRTFTLMPVLHTLGTFPIGVASGDFDRDGRVDLAVACNQGGYGLTTFHGNGDGTFAIGQAVSLLNGFYGTRLVAGDFDGDGTPDLAEAHYYGVRIVIANGLGGFTFGGDVGNELTESVCASDLDADGVLDLATVGIYSGILRVWHGVGNGSFSLESTLATGGFPRDVVPVDLTGDGVQDLVVPAQSNHVVQVFLGTGGGAYLPAQNVSSPYEPMEAIAGDWNGDGLPDLAAACRNFGSTAPVAVWFQTNEPTVFCAGDGSLTACPCGNNGDPAHGCGNSAFAAGALLSATGASKVAADTLALGAENMTGSLAIFFQGTSTFAPAVVDDGLGCVGGAIVRLGAKAVSAGASSYPQSGDPSVSVRGAVPPAGATRFYQCFYRNAAASFCPPATSNRTNGLSVRWTP